MRFSVSRLAALCLCFAMVAAISRAADKDGYIALANGKNMDGWKAFYDPKSKVDTSKNLTPKENGFVCSGVPTGFFYTEKSFSNYVLEYEWRFPEGSKPESNSGCLVHMQEPFNKIFPKCLEPQGRYLNHGKIFTIGIAKDEVEYNKFDQELLTKQLKPMGQWSKTEVTCSKDGVVKVKVNGVQVSECKSKLTSGPIGFQSEGTEVHFRNIRLKQLP